MLNFVGYLIKCWEQLNPGRNGLKDTREEKEELKKGSMVLAINFLFGFYCEG